MFIHYMTYLGLLHYQSVYYLQTVSTTINNINTTRSTYYISTHCARPSPIYNSSPLDAPLIIFGGTTQRAQTDYFIIKLMYLTSIHTVRNMNVGSY